MLNKFCFHLYAQNSLFIRYSRKLQCIFWDLLVTLSCDFRVHRAGSQLKKVHIGPNFGSRSTWPVKSHDTQCHHKMHCYMTFVIKMYSEVKNINLFVFPHFQLSTATLWAAKSSTSDTNFSFCGYLWAKRNSSPSSLMYCGKHRL